jgi:hypothetical protein
MTVDIKAIHHITGQCRSLGGPHVLRVKDDSYYRYEISLPFCVATKDEYVLSLSARDYDQLLAVMEAEKYGNDKPPAKLGIMETANRSNNAPRKEDHDSSRD